MLLLMEVTLSPSEYTQVLPFSPKTDRYEPKNIGLEKISWIYKPLSQLLQEHVMIPVTYLKNNQGLGVFSCSEYLYCRAVPKLSSSDVLSAYFKFPSEIYSQASYTRFFLSQNCCLVFPFSEQSFLSLVHLHPTAFIDEWEKHTEQLMQGTVGPSMCPSSNHLF